MSEGKFSRWSRLKSQKKLGNDYGDSVERAGLKNGEKKTHELGEQIEVEKVSLEVRSDDGARSIPVMEPLAGFEEGDTSFESPPIDALELLEHRESNAVGHIDPRIGVTQEDRPLTDEEKKVVDALPRLEELSIDSDFTPFLAEKVPGFVRRKALRILWQSNPAFSFLDGLNDYDEDYNVIDTLINAATDSSYQVGKGFRAEIENTEEKEDLNTAGKTGSKKVFEETEIQNLEKTGGDNKIIDEAAQTPLNEKASQETS